MKHNNELFIGEQEFLNAYSEINPNGFEGIDMNFNMDMMLQNPFTPQLESLEFPQGFDGFFTNPKKRRREADIPDGSSIPISSIESTGDPFLLGEDDMSGLSAAEIKRQIHIQSEQKRRAQIRDGFEELRMYLPNPTGSGSKQPSKAAILSRTIVYLQHLKATQSNLLVELENLRMENSHLKYANLANLQNQSHQPDLKIFNSLY